MAAITQWPAAFLSIGGTSASDVWVVGVRVAGGPTLLHWDGSGWTVHDLVEALGTHAVQDVDLWWVHAIDAEHVFFGGSDGAVLRWTSLDGFERMDTPGLLRQTVFGLWGTGTDDIYAVGGQGARSGFVWHWDGQRWRALPLPADMPKLPNGATAGLFKVCGDGQGTVYFVGAMGTVLRRVGDGPIERLPGGVTETLLTVDVAGEDVVAVGGSLDGTIVAIGGEGAEDRTPPGASMLQGVSIGEEGGEAWAVGAFGDVWRRHPDGAWRREPTGLDLAIESLHAVWVDPDGGVWAVGGNVISADLDAGALVVRGRDIGDATPPPIPEEPEPDLTCPEHDLQRGAHGTVARRWNEQALASIRRVIPEPGVHARNLFSLSVALFDAWAAFEPDQDGFAITEAALDPTDAAARDEAMSHAAFRLLSHRYARGTGAPISQDCYRKVMTDLGYDPDNTSTDGDSPSALGNRIGEAVISFFVDDGAREDTDYHDFDYTPPNPPLFVDEPGVGPSVDLLLWQPLNLARAVTQNGIAVPGGPQRYIGPHWGDVRPFAIRRADNDTTYFVPENPPIFLNEEMHGWVEEVLRFTSWLDPDDGEMMDISPGAYGNNSLGADDGGGHPINPATQEAYPPQIVPRADFGRVLISYWADGPNSETPPGHWNTILNRVSDHPAFEHRWRGEGPVLDRLTWDVHSYFILNGALHDAAITAWDLKRAYETSRPITLIRGMGERGQSSDPDLPSYDPEGLRLVPGLVELITAESSAPGERHELLAPYIGEVAVFAWPGDPAHRHVRHAPAAWIRAVEWVAWMPSTFVTPAFPGYTSGHSTFSRSAATVMAGITGSDYHPGGYGEFVARQGEYLEVEYGPSVEVRLQYATWFDAADQAAQSRIWSAIHIRPDDFDGRRSGSWVGTQALTFGSTFLQIEQVD